MFLVRHHQLQLVWYQQNVLQMFPVMKIAQSFRKKLIWLARKRNNQPKNKRYLHQLFRNTLIISRVKPKKVRRKLRIFVSIVILKFSATSKDGTTHLENHTQRCRMRLVKALVSQMLLGKKLVVRILNPDWEFINLNQL